LPCQAVNKHNGKSDQNSQERLCNCTSSESHKKGYGHSNNISHGKSAANKKQHLIQIYCPFVLQLHHSQAISIAPESMLSPIESKTD